MVETDKLIAAIFVGAKYGQGQEHGIYLRQYEVFVALLKERGKRGLKGKIRRGEIPFA